MTEIYTGKTVNVLICDSVDPELPDGLSREGYYVVYKPDITHDGLLELIHSFDIVVVRSRTKITRDVLDAADNLKLVARAGIGIDNIDSDAAREKGVKIITAAGSSTQSVVELNLALAIDLARKVTILNHRIRGGEFSKKKGRELSGSTCGIIGFGRIGYETARVLSTLGSRIIAYDIFENNDLMEKIGGRFVSLEDLLTSSDFIFITVTLNGESRGLLGRDEISKVKTGSFIINTSRAEAVDGSELTASLKNGKIGGYAADVMWNEPPKEEWEKELISMENVIITPHIGAQTHEGQKRVADTTLENIRRAVAGEI